MRDIHKSASYFTSYIEEEKELLLLLSQKISSSLDYKRKKSLQRMRLNSLLSLVITKYGLGEGKETIKTSLLETITAFENSFIWQGFEKGYGQYDQMIWLVSLSILCNIDIKDFKRITNILKRDNVKDKLLDKLINYKQSDWTITSYSYIQKHPYSLIDGVSNAAQIKLYLDTHWYKGHSDAAWHGSHTNRQVNLYFGYWAWEAAALAKILNIDDLELKDQKYYPYDAVHW